MLMCCNVLSLSLLAFYLSQSTFLCDGEWQKTYNPLSAVTGASASCGEMCSHFACGPSELASSRRAL